jgi:hypothetical protein
VARIVIDAGHGGHDPGAKARGIEEADLVLDVALRLEKLLKDTGVEVIMTRRTNTFVPLEERTAIANRSVRICSCRFTPTPARAIPPACGDLLPQLRAQSAGRGDRRP